MGDGRFLTPRDQNAAASKDQNLLLLHVPFILSPLPLLPPLPVQEMMADALDLLVVLVALSN